MSVQPAASPAAAEIDLPVAGMTDAAEATERARQLRILGVQAAVAVGVGLAILAAMWIPQSLVGLEDLNRLALVPATIVQLWAGRRFYVAAWRSFRHGFGTNM